MGLSYGGYQGAPVSQVQGDTTHKHHQSVKLVLRTEDRAPQKILDHIQWQPVCWCRFSRPMTLYNFSTESLGVLFHLSCDLLLVLKHYPWYKLICHCCLLLSNLFLKMVRRSLSIFIKKKNYEKLQVSDS